MQWATRSVVLQCVLLGSSSFLWAQSSVRVPEAPKALQPPKDQTLFLHLKGKGEQIYVCQNASGVYAWKLKAPAAKLFDEGGELTGQHFAGPTWQAKDESRVMGKVVTSVPSPGGDSIPWLLLTASSHQGAGVMSKVQSIQRLQTKGGVAPVGGCAAGNENGETAVPYEAEYYFYGR